MIESINVIPWSPMKGNGPMPAPQTGVFSEWVIWIEGRLYVFERQ
jgi:hypothetical protein